jgi:hypothetical protein
MRNLVIGTTIVVIGMGCVLFLKRAPNDIPPVENPNPQTTADTGYQGLAEAKQKLIWDAEHTTFELETKLGKPFVVELKKRNPAFLTKFFLSDFDGETIDLTQSMPIVQSSFREIRYSNKNVPKQVSDAKHGTVAAGFVSFLTELLVEMKSIDRGKFRVLKIEQDSDESTIWRLDTLLQAFGVNSNGGPIEVGLKGKMVCQFLDAKKIQDGPCIQSWIATTATIRQSDTQLMKEVTEEAGLAKLPIQDNWLVDKDAVQQQHMQFAVEDFNLDGYLDIAVATHQGIPILLQSVQGSRFEDVASKIGLRRWYISATKMTFTTCWIDYDNDGWPDLLMGNRLYRNIEGKRFRDVSIASGLSLDDQPMGTIVCDYDCDGLLDLYVTYQLSADNPATPGSMPWVNDDKSGGRNHLWHNEGNGKFKNVAVAAKASGGLKHSFAASWLHINDDHFPDLYIANDFGGNVMLENAGDGTFKNVTKETGVGDFATSMGVATGDLNNDGRSEIYVANMFSKMGRRIIANVCEDDYPPDVFAGIQGACAGNRLYGQANDSNKYVESAEPLGINAVGWAHGAAMGDIDGDGWLDLYSTAGFFSFDRHKPDG